MSAIVRSAVAWTPPSDEWDVPGMDAVFVLGEVHDLSVPQWFPAAAMEAHLAHSLLRQPLDLATHTRRILFWLDQPDHAGLGDALADLAQVLNGKGAGLMERLLQKARPFLPADEDARHPRARVESRYALFADAEAWRFLTDSCRKS